MTFLPLRAVALPAATDRLYESWIQSIAAELDELPLPYLFDVKALSAIRQRSLREHIERVGVRILGSPDST